MDEILFTMDGPLGFTAVPVVNGHVECRSPSAGVPEVAFTQVVLVTNLVLRIVIMQRLCSLLRSLSQRHDK